MVGTGRCAVVCIVAAVAGIGCVGVVSVVTGSTVVGNGCVGSVQGVIIAVNRESCGFPARRCGVAHRAIRREIECYVVGVGSLTEIWGVASRTLGRGSGISCCMTFHTIGLQVCTSQRKTGCIVVKSSTCIAGRVTGQTSGIFIHITIYTAVSVVGFRVDVANNTRVFSIVRWICVAFRALRPLPLVLAAVNGEISAIVCRKSRGHPIGIGGMTSSAVGGKLSAHVIGCLSARKIRLVAGITIIGRVGKFATQVALPAIRNFVPFGQREKIMVHLIRSPIGC